VGAAAVAGALIAVAGVEAGCGAGCVSGELTGAGAGVFEAAGCGFASMLLRHMTFLPSEIQENPAPGGRYPEAKNYSTDIQASKPTRLRLTFANATPKSQRQSIAYGRQQVGVRVQKIPSKTAGEPANPAMRRG
jgi:hypothetical protein